jgi:FixJ family two-component response regulator
MSNLQKIVAVIDDDPEMRAALVMLLRSHGYSVETFDSAETFLTFASKSRATCLLVDIQLGDITGVELARQLTAEGFKFPDVAVERKAAAAGGIAFLRKPFPATTLMDAIKKAAG